MASKWGKKSKYARWKWGVESCDLALAGVIVMGKAGDTLDPSLRSSVPATIACSHLHDSLARLCRASSTLQAGAGEVAGTRAGKKGQLVGGGALESSMRCGSTAPDASAPAAAALGIHTVH